MEFSNYLTVDTIATFAMALVVIELWVNFTKELPVIKKIPTKFYTWLVAVLHLSIINTSINIFNLSILGIYMLMCNALLLAVILCGGYDIYIGKININKGE